MKSPRQIIDELNQRRDFCVKEIGLDGGAGYFRNGPMRGMTVIWSYGGGWEHVSVDGKKRMPDWDEMCKIKDMFWNEDETCIEYHPAKNDYVNQLPFCLHIWKPIEKTSGALPVPPAYFVGLGRKRQ